MKICSLCGEEKSQEKFYRRSGENKYRKDCKDCNNKRKQNWMKNNIQRAKEIRRKEYLQYRYGITEEEFEDLIHGQDGRCWICGIDLVISGLLNNSAVIDHDHKTGQIRGILCNNCNTGLGRFKDNIQFLQSAIAYLEK